ncbi:MAG: hypothetical protein GY803_03880, partial [Chloroflexi bacterium]|nr:hypothetical protein [Chloroflexota bacterium]
MGLIWAVWHYPFTIYFTVTSVDAAAMGAPVMAIVLPALIGQTMSLIVLVLEKRLGKEQ